MEVCFHVYFYWRYAFSFTLNEGMLFSFTLNGGMFPVSPLLGDMLSALLLLDAFFQALFSMSNPISFTHNSCISNVSFIRLHTFSLILNASPSQLFHNVIILFSLTPTAYLSSFTFSCCIFIGSSQNTLSRSISSLSSHPLRLTPWGETISNCGLKNCF